MYCTLKILIFLKTQLVSYSQFHKQYKAKKNNNYPALQWYWLIVMLQRVCIFEVVSYYNSCCCHVGMATTVCCISQLQVVAFLVMISECFVIKYFIWLN